MLITIRYLSKTSTIQPFEITYWQGLTGVIFNIILFWYLQKKNPKDDIVKIPKEARLPLMLRGIFGFGGNIFAVTSFKLIPLTKATVIINTNPIFIGIFGVLLLKEQISGFDVAGIFVTFMGVVIFLLDSF
jgi:drug/metabolite transporter (DMT)-like permease